MAKPRIRVCFVSLHAYPLFDSSALSAFGGSEVRAFLFSTALAQDPDFDVSCVVRDDGQPDRQRLHGVSVWRHTGYVSPLARAVVRPTAGGSEPARGARRLTLANLAWYARCRLSHSLRWRFLTAGPLLQRFGRRIQIGDYFVNPVDTFVYERIGADVYCVLGVSNLAGEVAAYCRTRGKRFVLFIADITNLDESYSPESHSVNVYGDRHFVCRYAIDNADLIVAQLQTQRQLLYERFGRQAVLIRNPIDLSETEGGTAPEPHDRQIALWVGRADNFKKMPMVLIELAKASPDVQFVMIMNPSSEQVEQAVRAACPANVTIHKRMPYHELDALFSKAFVYISTAESEGFPNTFLQAGRRGTPILSYQVDPDGFIQTYGCGVVADGRFDELANGLRRIQNDWRGARRYSTNVRAYVQRHHELGARIQELESALSGLAPSAADHKSRPPQVHTL